MEPLSPRRQRGTPERAVAIGLGGNLGDSRTYLQRGLAALASAEGVRLAATSPFYRTAPIGPPQPDYLNGCALLWTKLSAQGLLDLLHSIEDRFGRQRGERWGPRTLDLDLLLYGEDIIQTPVLEVPHPRMVERGFVLIPLADIAPGWRHPCRNQTVAQLLEAWRSQPPNDGHRTTLMTLHPANNATVPKDTHTDTCPPVL